MAVVRLLTPIDQVGPTELEAAIADAVASNLPTVGAFRQVLHRRLTERGLPPPVTVRVTNERASRVAVRNHDLAAYDQLNGTFIDDAENAILVGPNGVGKSMILKSLAHHALAHGHTVRFTTASDMLADLAAQDSPSALARRMRRWTLDTTADCARGRFRRELPKSSKANNHAERCETA